MKRYMGFTAVGKSLLLPDDAFLGPGIDVCTPEVGVWLLRGCMKDVDIAYV